MPMSKGSSEVHGVIDAMTLHDAHVERKQRSAWGHQACAPAREIIFVAAAGPSFNNEVSHKMSEAVVGDKTK